MSRELPQSLPQGKEVTPQPEEKKNSETRGFNRILSDMTRVGCTGGALFHPAASKTPIMTTGVVIDPLCDDLGEVMQNAPGVMLYNATADNPEAYRTLLQTYKEQFVTGSGEKVEFGGPGLIAILDLNDVSQIEAILTNHQEELFNASQGNKEQHYNEQDKQTLYEIAKHPVLLRVSEDQELSDIHDRILPEIALACEQGRVNGFVFSEPNKLRFFRKEWKFGSITKDKEVPFTVFCSDFKGLKEFFESPKNVCDTYMCTEELSDEQSAEIRDLRLASILASVRTKIETLAFTPLGTKTLEHQTDRNIIIGVLALQGASKLEKWLLSEVVKKYNPTYGIDVRYVYTADHLEHLNPDALVLPGGWHGPMLEMIQKVDMTEAIKDFVRQKHKAIIASCAGAIAVRSPDKKSTGCSEHEPLGIGDYGVDNNALNGILPYRVELNGGSRLSPVMDGLFVGGPEFIRQGEQVTRLAKVEGSDAIVGVRQEFPEFDSVLYALSVHSLAAYFTALSDLSRRINEGKMYQ